MGESVLFLTHNHPEGGSDEGRSKYNVWEAQMAVQLARHLLRQQAYGSQDITILTPYLGQLQRLRAELKKWVPLHSSFVLAGWLGDYRSCGTVPSACLSLTVERLVMLRDLLWITVSVLSYINVIIYRARQAEPLQILDDPKF